MTSMLDRLRQEAHKRHPFCQRSPFSSAQGGELRRQEAMAIMG
jgi:hypothetical protein